MSENVADIRIVDNNKKSGLAIACLVLGIVGIVGSWIPLLNVFSIILGIVGLGLGIPAFIIYLARKKGSLGITIAGLILCILTFVIAVSINSAAVSSINKALGTSGNNSSGSKNTQASTEALPKVGDVIKTDNFEIKITSIKQKTKVGGGYSEKKPSTGGIYVVVDWQYKNITDKPIGTFSVPSIKISDKNGTSYDSDLGATMYYAIEAKFDTKVLSNLNPGITVKDGEVFEVSKDLFKAGGWKLDISSDKDVSIKIN